MPTFYPYRVARVFSIAGTDEDRLLYQTFDLLLSPQRGHPWPDDPAVAAGAGGSGDRVCCSCPAGAHGRQRVDC